MSGAMDDRWEPRQIAEATYLDEGTFAQHRRRYNAKDALKSSAWHISQGNRFS
jgi:hypothetical protein